MQHQPLATASDKQKAFVAFNDPEGVCGIECMEGVCNIECSENVCSILRLCELDLIFLFGADAMRTSAVSNLALSEP